MEHPFKEAFQFYTSKIEYMALFSFTIVLPILLVHYLIMNYVYAVTPVINNTTPGADLLYSFLTLIFLTIAQIPIIRFVYCDQEGHEKPLADAFKHFVLFGFSTFLFAISYALISLAGMFLFILPGLVIMLLLFLTPYLSALDQKPTRKVWKKAILLGKKKFFPLLLIVLSVGFIEMIIGIISQFIIYSYTSSYGVQVLAQILLNMIIFPFMVVMITMFVMKWRSETVAEGI